MEASYVGLLLGVANVWLVHCNACSGLEAMK
jgi:hypothetical protein